MGGFKSLTEEKNHIGVTEVVDKEADCLEGGDECPGGRGLTNFGELNFCFMDGVFGGEAVDEAVDEAVS